MAQSVPVSAGSILGNPVIRREDPGILTGETRVPRRPRRSTGCCTSRSSGRRSRTPAIEAIDTDDAKAMPGVVAVYAPDDLDLADHHGFVMLPPTMNRPPLARRQGALRRRHRRDGHRRDRRPQALDAAETVIVDYDPLPGGRRHGSRARPDAPLLHEDARFERRQRDGHRAGRGRARRRRRRRHAAHREPAVRRGADGAERNRSSFPAIPTAA